MLTEEQFSFIKELNRRGISLKRLASRLGISHEVLHSAYYYAKHSGMFRIDEKTACRLHLEDLQREYGEPPKLNGTCKECE